MSDHSRLPPPRLLLIGLLLAAVFSAVDHWLLTQLQAQQYTTTRGVLTMGAFVAQVGLLGWLCGRFLDNPWWRWGFFVWGWVLIDLQLFATWGLAGRELPFALLAAQISLATIWAILGTTHWTIRIPGCATLGTVILLLMEPGNRFVNQLFPVQMVALIGLCIILRSTRFQLARVGTVEGTAKDPVGHKQFAIRHVLIWTTGLAVLLGIFRAFDAYSWMQVTADFERRRTALLTAGLLMASVHVVSMWAALGFGSWSQRLLVLSITLPAIGLTLALLHWYSSLVPVLRKFSSFVSLWNDPIWQNEFWYYNAKLIVWVPLSGSLLAASLIILRVIGYRLVRRTRPSSTPGVVNQLTP